MSTTKLIVQEGKSLSFTATAAVSYADIIVFGTGVGVAQNDAIIGQTITVLMTGVIVRPVATADVVAYRDTLYWDDTAKEFTTDDDSGANVTAGLAWETKAAGVAAEIGVKIG